MGIFNESEGIFNNIAPSLRILEDLFINLIMGMKRVIDSGFYQTIANT